MQTQRAYSSSKAACIALNFCSCYLRSEKFLKKSCSRVAIQNEVRAIFRHGAYPPEGPKRSVLMERG
jgi:hypothetical protein